MHTLDIRTIVVSSLAIFFICGMVLATLWIHSRRRFRGIGLWVADYALTSAGAVLLLLRGLVPDWLSMVVANTLVMAGATLLLAGVRAFFGKPARMDFNYVLIAVFLNVHIFFSTVRPDLAARTINVACGLAIVSGQIAWFALRSLPRQVRGSAAAIGQAMLLFAAINIMRAALTAIYGVPSSEFFSAGVIDAAALLAYLMFFVVLTFILVMAVNRRLQDDIEVQERKFTTAFRSAPFAMMLSRARDGMILDANDMFARMSGHPAARAVGRTTGELGLLPEGVDREEMIALVEQGRVDAVEMRYRHKDGRIMYGLFSAAMIEVGGEPAVITVIADISGQKRDHEQIDRQLRELRALNTMMLEREERVRELKQEVNGLLAAAGKDRKYGPGNASGNATKGRE